MQDKLVATRRAAWQVGAFLSIVLAPVSAAFAFPFLDVTNQDSTPTVAPVGTDLPTSDITGLQNQLRLVNPAAQGNPGAWTIIPRITFQEEFTDNALEVTSPRRGDAITVISPGIAILADTSRIKLNFDYQPSLLMHAIDGPLNVVTQQLNGMGTITVVPDFAYVDIRAVSGVQSSLGVAGGGGSLGSIGYGGTNGTTGTLATNGVGTGQVAGLNRNDEVQTSSFGISPYLLRQFGDYGTGKLGVSGGVSSNSSISGFASSPIPLGGGVNQQRLYSTEEIGQFTSGEVLEKLQDTFLVDVSQSSSQTSGAAEIPGANSTSQRETVNNQLSYALNRTFTLLASIGAQNIQYHPAINAAINGLTWNVGITYAPTPNTAATLSYGRNNGADSFTADAHVALTARTLLSVDYSNTVGTQLENTQSQLNAAGLASYGFVNAQTGGQAFVATNAAGVATGVFRYSTLNASFVTVWDRDSLQSTLTWSKQTSLSPTSTITSESFDLATGTVSYGFAPGQTAGQTNDVKTGAVTWIHLVSPDTTLSANASYTLITRSAGEGNDGTLSVATGLQYAISPTTTLTGSYSFFDRISKITGYSLYENLLLLGITRKF